MEILKYMDCIKLKTNIYFLENILNTLKKLNYTDQYKYQIQQTCIENLQEEIKEMNNSYISCIKSKWLRTFYI